jgi:hypothetical protein
MARKSANKPTATHRIPVTQSTYEDITTLKEYLHQSATYEDIERALISCYANRHHILLNNNHNTEVKDAD